MQLGTVLFGRFSANGDGPFQILLKFSALCDIIPTIKRQST